jgi:hypothetical protein
MTARGCVLDQCVFEAGDVTMTGSWSYRKGGRDTQLLMSDVHVEVLWGCNGREVRPGGRV